MAEQTLTQNKIYQWGVIVIFLAYPSFVVSVLLFPLLLIILLGSVLLLFIFEQTTKTKSKNWLRLLCFSWLVLAVPTYGIMPMLIALRWHYFLPLGRQLGIFTGITLTATYNLFKSTPGLDDVDHPFPPLTELQIYLLGISVLLISIVPVIYFIKHGIRDNQ